MLVFVFCAFFWGGVVLLLLNPAWFDGEIHLFFTIDPLCLAMVWEPGRFLVSACDPLYILFLPRGSLGPVMVGQYGVFNMDHKISNSYSSCFQQYFNAF